MSSSLRPGEREDAVLFTSPLWGEVGRRPGEGAQPTTALLDCGRDVIPQKVPIKPQRPAMLISSVPLPFTPAPPPPPAARSLRV